MTARNIIIERSDFMNLWVCVNMTLHLRKALLFAKEEMNSRNFDWRMGIQSRNT